MITATAHPNFALIKYWGKANEKLNLPAVGSISVTVDKLMTRTSVKFDRNLKKDLITLNNTKVDQRDSKRIISYLDLVRGMAKERRFAEVNSLNNFPTAAGLSSSSAGFAALALSASRAIGLDLNPNDLSVLARRGSGSAARSIHGGFVELVVGDREDGRDSRATPIGDKEFWSICIMIAITAKSPKGVSSRDGMRITAKTSPYYPTWIASTQTDLSEMREAILARDITKVGELSEHSCLKMHGAMLSANPGIIYWNGGTLSAIEAVRDLRRQGHPVFFTIDAGPQVKIICEPESKPFVEAALKSCSGVVQLVATRPGPGARLVRGGA